MRISTFFTMFALVCALEIPTTAQESGPSAQPEQTGRVLGTVVRGNTTIVFEAPTLDTSTRNRLRTWGDFAERHPTIARTLAHRPSLINDATYLRKHPELATFFETHPDIKSAMADNTGNFAAFRLRSGE